MLGKDQSWEKIPVFVGAQLFSLRPTVMFMPVGREKRLCLPKTGGALSAKIWPIFYFFLYSVGPDLGRKGAILSSWLGSSHSAPHIDLANQGKESWTAVLTVTLVLAYR